jgi:ABC-type branched-subunit amino acid transport system permease subunit
MAMLAIVIAVQTSVNSRPTVYTLLRVMMAQSADRLVVVKGRLSFGVGGRTGVGGYCAAM